MNLSTIFQAYHKVTREKSVVTSLREGHDWGIMVENDWHAKSYQRRDRQAWTFYVRLTSELEKLSPANIPLNTDGGDSASSSQTYSNPAAG
jgi:hypothetical protein